MFTHNAKSVAWPMICGRIDVRASDLQRLGLSVPLLPWSASVFDDVVAWFLECAKSTSI